MKTGGAGLTLIKLFEGFRSKPYKCPAGIPSIGYGSTRYADGSAVQLSDKPINQEQADELLRLTLGSYEDAVSRSVRVLLNQNQYDSLVSLAYNIGAGNFSKSTLVKKLNAHDPFSASLEFARWINGGGKVLPGLVRRREAERLLFVRPV